MKNRNQKTSDEDLGSLAPRLAMIPKQNDFKVPEKYFESFAESVHQRIKTKPSESAKVISIFAVKKLAYGLSAAIVLLVCGIYYYNNYTTVPKQDLSAFQITAADLSESNYLLSIDEDLIIETALASNIHSGNTSIDYNDIEQYLIDQNIEMNQLIIEL